MKVAHDAAELAAYAADRAGRGGGILRLRRGLSRTLSRAAAPHRDADSRRRPGRGHASRRARLLAAALAIRRCSRRRPRPRSTWRERERLGELAVDGTARARLQERRHARVPLSGRRVLFHRDEHAPAGRASGHRDGQRHRPRARADAHRRRRPARLSPGRHQLCGHAIECRINAENPDTFAPVARPGHRLSCAGRARRARRQRALSGLHGAALLRQPDREARSSTARAATNA